MTNAPSLPTISLEEHQRALEAARLDGFREGETKASLERLFQASREQSQMLMAISEKLTVFQAEVTRQGQETRAHAQDIAEMKTDIAYLKQHHVTPKHLEALDTNLKGLSDQVNGFIWKLALSGLSGGGVAAGLTYGILNALGVV